MNQSLQAPQLGEGGLGIGLELEGWVSTSSGAPVALLEVPALSRYLAQGSTPFGHLTVEPGLGAMEVVGQYAPTVPQASSNILQLLGIVEKAGLRPILTMCSPFKSGLEPSVKASRLQALWLATREEVIRRDGGDAAWLRIQVMNQHAATQIHISHPELPVGPDFIDPRMIFVGDILNNCGPAIARILCDKYRIDNTGHLGIWHGWALARRFPEFGRWFGSFLSFKHHFEQTPRLIKSLAGDNKGADGWVVDLVNFFRWGDPADEFRGYWHAVRYRAGYGTAEIRILPSCPPDRLEAMVQDLMDFVLFLVGIYQGGDYGSFDEFKWTSPEWGEIVKFKIGGTGTIPFNYGRAQWCAQAFS